MHRHDRGRRLHGRRARSLAPLAVVQVGLLGKLFGPVGVVSAVSEEDLPLRLGLTLLTNDAIWWGAPSPSSSSMHIRRSTN